jgi:hypothetical protein
MEFALSRGCERKPRELMTPSKHEGVFYVQLYFGDARRRTWDWSAVLDVWNHCLDGMMGGGLVTLERAKVIRYRSQGRS